MRRSYLRHDGQADEGYYFIPGYFHLLSVSETFPEWEKGWQFINGQSPDPAAIDPRVKRVYGDPAWVAIADNVGSDGICLDFDPLPGGEVGQIIYFDHGDSYRRWLAPSFRVWMEMIVSDLETGRLVWNAELEGYQYPEAEEEGART